MEELYMIQDFVLSIVIACICYCSSLDYKIVQLKLFWPIMLFSYAQRDCLLCCCNVLLMLKTKKMSPTR